MRPATRPTEVDDPDDAALDDYRHLTDASARRSTGADAPHGITIVEGAVALEQLAASELEVRSVLCTPARAERHVELFERMAAPVLVADRSVLESVTGYDVHRGLLASARRPPPLDTSSLLTGADRLVLAEGVTDNENIGALFRCAAALGLHGVLLDPVCADPLYRRSVRVSSGWSLRVPHARTGSASGALEEAHRRGFVSIALTPAADSIPVDDAAASGLLADPLLLVVGAEGPGLSDRVLRDTTHRVRIPMTAQVDSLNVATSVAVVAAFAGAGRGWT